MRRAAVAVLLCVGSGRAPELTHEPPPEPKTVAAAPSPLPAERVQGVEAAVAGHAQNDHILDLPAAPLNAQSRPEILGNVSLPYPGDAFTLP